MIRIILAGYGFAWRALLPIVRAAAGSDRRMRALIGRGFLPGSWQVTERLAEGIDSAGEAAGHGGARALWLHCASLGEAKGMWAFALSLNEAEAVHLTASTGSGAAFLRLQCRDLAARDGNGMRRLTASIAPFDHPEVVRRFLERRRVRGLCLYEVELWPHYLAGCRDLGLRTVLVSGRLSPKAFARYRRFGGAGARLLDGLAWIQAQSAADRDRFLALTATETVVGFDYKAVHFLTHSLPAASSRLPARFAFVSLHLPELRLLLPGFAPLMRRGGVLVFPRRMSEVGAFRRLLEPLGFTTYSRDPGAGHLLVDSLGLVADLLPQCHSAFVGGSLIPLGCHNLWEPLAAGLKIYFGPYVENQQASAALLRERGIAEVLNEPTRIGAVPLPGPEIRAACGTLLADLQGRLDSALADGSRRIFVTFYPNANARIAADA
ncbi:MAG: glycosyltransferase N-terminal domain-containing protein [Fibrobacteria bacterium]